MKTHGTLIMSKAKRLAKAEVDKSWAGSLDPDERKNVKKLWEFRKAVMQAYANKVDKDINKAKAVLNDILAFCEVQADGPEFNNLPIPKEMFFELKTVLRDLEP